MWLKDETSVKLNCHPSVESGLRETFKLFIYYLSMETDKESEPSSFSEECIDRLCSSENETNNSMKSQSKFELSASLKEELLKFPEVLKFIETLKKYIEKQKRKIRKLKSRIKKRKHVHTQTEEYITTETENNRVPKSISEEITEAAEIATKNSGFVYEETSGMYYDYNSGYYYNAEYGLYYDGNSGTYMTYNQATDTYDFYSKVDIAQNPAKNPDVPIGSKPKISKKRKKKSPESEQASKRDKPEIIDLLEDGECSNSSAEEILHVSNSDEDVSDIGNGWPPCMRIIIEKSAVQTLKQGSLFVITYEGGTLGREGDHSILIPDINVSKHHLKFTFDEPKGHFHVQDLGSRNGTTLNGKRMSASKQESDALEVTHGSHIQIGSTVLLCHVHEGHHTCGHCEPGLIQKEDDKEDCYYLTNKSKSHKKELQNLRKKFGVQHNDGRSQNLAPGYTDRAQVRRNTVGSQNANEKTQVASVNESISSENKGFKMLAKMGWSEGQSLGKDGQGLVEPIEVVANQGTSGMGSIGNSFEVVQPLSKQNIWKKAQERFKNLPSSPEEIDNSD